MSKLLSTLAAVSLCLLMTGINTSNATGQEKSAQQSSSRSHYFPNTQSGIHLEMVFNYGLADPSPEAGVVDMVWGSSYATQPAGVYNSAYIPYSVDNFTNPVAWYQTNHPDWLEYKCDKTTLAFEFGTTTLAPLNFADPAVRAYQYAHWIDAPLAQGYSGIAVDTMSLTNQWNRCGHYDSHGVWIQQYSGAANDATFKADVLDWESAVYTHVHVYSPTATMQVNASYDFTQSMQDNLRFMTATDLVLDERGFTNWGSESRNVTTPAEWQTIATVIENVQYRGVCYMTNGEEPQPTTEITQEERLWVLANYLLLKNNCTYVSITGITNGAQDYGKLWVFPEYTAAIGRPLGVLTRVRGIWMRKFSGGLTLVNPSNFTANVPLPPGKYVDVNGDKVGSVVTMNPQTGLILLLAN